MLRTQFIIDNQAGPGEAGRCLHRVLAAGVARRHAGRRVCRHESRSATAAVLAFECPLSERARTWLRLEELFARTRVYSPRAATVLTIAARLLSLFDIVDTAGRSDLKTDLLQELDRQRSVWGTQLDNPEVAREALAEFLADMDAVIHDCMARSARSAAPARERMACRQCANARPGPGGACSFELPMLR